VDIRSGQRRAWENKKARGFNTTDVPLEFCLLPPLRSTNDPLEKSLCHRGSAGLECSQMSLTGYCRFQSEPCSLEMCRPRLATAW